MNVLSQEHPFLIREWGLNILEIINIDTEIDASHRALGAMFILSRKFENLVFTLPPDSNLAIDVGPQLRELAKKVNLKIVFMSNDQVPFSLDFVETFNSSEDAVRRLKSAIIFKKIAKEFADVTPFKSSALSLLGMMNEPDITFAKLEEAIAHEPLLIARVLQTANSAFFMRRNKVEDIGQALAYLGLDGFKQVLVQLIFQNLATRYFANQEERLKHSEAVAHLAVKLAERKTRDAVLLGKIRVAGLLHDIGALAMQFCFPDEYKKVQDFQKQQNVTIIMAERKYFGIDHCEVGTKLCLEWGLPAYLMECAREHHNQICKNHENIIMPVIVANAFLNVEVEQVQTMDYKPLLITFCPGHPASENEARLDVQSFLYAQWKAYQQSLDVPQS
jgi:putative nucleotidyltransferase with HDIG domain